MKSEDKSQRTCKKLYKGKNHSLLDLNDAHLI